jgi:chromosome segregation ATPase
MKPNAIAPEQVQTVDFLDKERQKQQQQLAALTERLNALTNENAALLQRHKEMESEVTKAVTLAARITSFEITFEQIRSEIMKQIDLMEKRHSESEREQDRYRATEREGMNKILVDTRKMLDAVPKLEQDMIARKDEENRISKMANELQQKFADVVRRDEERARQMAAFEESRRQDNKRAADLQTENIELRKRSDENRAKIEILEDLVRRNDTRIGELMLAENDRRMSQLAWMENQAVAGAERDRTWNELKAKMDTVLQNAEDFSRRMDTYSETHRQMKKLIEEFYVNIERIDRRINEASEVQRLSEERFRQEWNAFLADEQKRWTTHMLLRDEQWRDHDRQAAKSEERLVSNEDRLNDIAESLRSMLAHDQTRMQAIYNLIRDALAEYEQTLTKVR